MLEGNEYGFRRPAFRLPLRVGEERAPQRRGSRHFMDLPIGGVRLPPDDRGARYEDGEPGAVL
jgi:hypothetical protein